MTTKAPVFFAILLIASAATTSEVHAAANPRLSPMLQDGQARSLENDSLIHVVIFLENSAIQQQVALTGDNPSLNRSSRIKQVASRLRSYKSDGAVVVETWLKANGVRDAERLWIVPAYVATVPSSLINDLATLDAVKLVVPDAGLEFDPPVLTKPSPDLAASVSTQLQMLKVPSLWARGITGKGRLVCSFDTGVEESHPALTGKWRGNHATLSSSWFSPIKPDSLPFDATGHGTHTMGIMVGSVDADTFGVAPGAEWITAGVIDQGRTLSVTVSDILKAFQWVLDPDGNPATTDDVPDVILNSWGIPKGLFADCDETFWQAIDNVEAAGIVTIFAAGNEGPNSQTIRIPADRSTTPINSFCVGAVDNSKVIASFSSRGPASCDPSQIKPEVVAPGVSIRSSTKGGTYAYMSGTSMAAPFIAGLVALCRQYNPDATAEQIKYAFIQSAEDLGVAGEDNNYGNGLVDAGKMLDYLPAPITPDFVVMTSSISAGQSVPGDTMALTVNLSNTAANLEQVVGRLEAVEPAQATILQDISEFVFGMGESLASNAAPFEVCIDKDVRHGDTVSFRLFLEKDNGQILDSVEFSVQVGILPPGSIGEHTGGGLEFGVSDFGQFGFGPHSMYYAAETGFEFDGGANLLYEAGIIIGADSEHLSNSVRDAYGDFRVSDFTPVESLDSGWLDADQGYHLDAAYSDDNSPTRLPIEVRQETIDYHRAGDVATVILRFSLINTGLTTLDSVRFGFLADFDLSAGSDVVEYNTDLNMIYQIGESGATVGLQMLSNLESVTVLSNGDAKVGLSETRKYEIISADGNNLSTQPGDLMFVVGSRPLTIRPGDTALVSFALIAGADIAELFDHADQAATRYDSLAAGRNQRQTVPDDYVLNQNYPNPFNPSTTISYSLPVGGHVILDVFNTLGQRVARLVDGFVDAGSHQIEWNGTNDGGSRVATGVYFYRLSTSDFSQTCKMVLLK